jgi:GNAT superfamily N-acetyltransferase
MAVYPLTAFPKDLRLRDGTIVQVRPLDAGDEKSLLEFFLAIPEQDRFQFKHDVTAPTVVADFCRSIDYDRALPLVAVLEGRIVAQGVLIRNRGFFRRKVGELRLVVHPEFRSKGLGSAMIRDLCEIANEVELDRVVFELVVGMQDDAIRAVDGLGFVRSATLVDHVRDPENRPRDLAIYVLPLGKWFEWWGY